jgi:nucleoside 2-deoxyribosyltransferase
MNHKTVYLAGPIHGRTDDECKAWRNDAASVLGGYGIACIDPTQNDYRGVEDTCTDAIVSQDKKWIDDSAIVLVNANAPSWGTAMEVFYGFMSAKHIVAFSNAASISPWLRCHTTAVFGTLAEACDWIVWATTAARGDE